MTKLKGIPSARLGPAPASRFGPAPFTNEADRSRHRREVNPWRKWYDEPEWRRMAWACKVKASFICAMCGTIAAAKGDAIADHVTPHRGDRALFFDETNLQCLCKACHDGRKQAEERAAGW
jgi:5-methylcytosine-specific restriction protein A